MVLVGGVDGWCWWVVLVGGVGWWCWRVVLVDGVDGWCWWMVLVLVVMVVMVAVLRRLSLG